MKISIFNSQGERINSVECTSWILRNRRDQEGSSLTIKVPQENDAIFNYLLLQQITFNKKYHFILHDINDKRVLVSNCEFQNFGRFENKTYEYIFNFGIYTSAFHPSVSEDFLITSYLNKLIEIECNTLIQVEETAPKTYFKKMLDKAIGELNEYN